VRRLGAEEKSIVRQTFLPAEENLLVEAMQGGYESFECVGVRQGDLEDAEVTEFDERSLREMAADAAARKDGAVERPL